MYQLDRKTKMIVGRGNTMESGDHYKNGASPKSQMNKRNFLKRFALLSSGAFVFGRQAGAQCGHSEVRVYNK